MNTAVRLQLPQDDLLARVRERDPAAFRTLMQRHNQRLFRIARGVLGNDAEAEDVVQETYVRAFTHLDGFRGDALISTWLTRIAVNEALGRLRQRQPAIDFETLDEAKVDARWEATMRSGFGDDPEAAAGRADARRLLEQALDVLPPPFRLVFILRDVEDFSVEETAAELGLQPATVKTRLHRARRMMRARLKELLCGNLHDLYPFGGSHCARIADAVMRRPEIEGVLARDP